MIARLLGNRLYLSAVGVAAVLAVTSAYLYTVVLDQPLTSRPDRVTVELASTGGLFEGSAVTYRGVKVGRVTDIETAPAGVAATISLDPGAAIPADSPALVRSLSPVGEQYLDFQPRGDDGPFLDDGDTVAAESTDVPKTLASTVIAVDEVLRQVDDRKLRVVLRELSTGLAGTGAEIGRLVDQGDLLLTDLEELFPETDRLLRNADTVLDLPVDQRADLRRLGRSSRQLAAFLRDYDPELRRTLRRAPGQLRQLADLVQQVRAVLPSFLRVGGDLAGELAAHEPHLRTLFRAYPEGLGTLLDQVREGKLYLQIISQTDARCRYPTERRDPTESGRRQLPTDHRCSASFDRLQRGAAHAPGPGR